MIVLIPVRHPLTEYNRRAIETGLEFVDTQPDGELLVLHVNQLHKSERVSRQELREAVEAEFGAITASYIVRNSFLVEEAILDEAARQGVDRIVLSERRYRTWQQRLRETLGIDMDLEAYLSEHLDAKISIVTE